MFSVKLSFKHIKTSAVGGHNFFFFFFLSFHNCFNKCIRAEVFLTLHGRKLEVAWLVFCSVYVSTRSVIFAILISKCLSQCLLSIFGQLGRNLWKLGTNETCLVKQYKRLRKASLFCNNCLEKKLNINLRCIFLLICFFS